MTENYLERLSELGSGNEGMWDYVPAYVREGLISPQEAMEALFSCLENRLGVYEGWARSGTCEAACYGQGRLEEARRAMDAIRHNLRTGTANPDPVVFRGHRLSSEASS